MKKIWIGLLSLLILVGCSPKDDDKSPSVTLYLIRHGETVYNVEGKAQGVSDSPLTEVGIAQAEALGEALKDVSFEKVVTSPSQRAVDTATLVTEQQAHQDDRLMEMNFGSLEGKSGKLLWEKGMDYHFEHGWKEYGGEDFYLVSDRMMAVMRELGEDPLNSDKNILISTHGMSILAALYAIDAEAADALPGGLDNCSITIVEYNNGNFVLKTLNDTSYLN